MHPLRHALPGSRGGLVGVRPSLGSLRGLELVPAKWRCLVVPTSTPQGAWGQNESR